MSAHENVPGGVNVEAEGASTDQGRIEEAERLFESLRDRTNHLGLFAEQIDPETGSFLGNFPQAFSHIGVIISATNLAKREGERDA